MPKVFPESPSEDTGGSGPGSERATRLPPSVRGWQGPLRREQTNLGIVCAGCGGRGHWSNSCPCWQKAAPGAEAPCAWGPYLQEEAQWEAGFGPPQLESLGVPGATEWAPTPSALGPVPWGLCSSSVRLSVCLSWVFFSSQEQALPAEGKGIREISAPAPASKVPGKDSDWPGWIM